MGTFSISRHFNGSRQALWEAWTVPMLMEQWWGPKGCTTETKRMELRPGGVFHSSLILPDGTTLWTKFTYRDVTPPARLIWEHSFSNAAGDITRHPASADWPLKLFTTVTFTEEKDGTLLTLNWAPLDATDKEIATFEASMESMKQGWTGTFDQLEEFLQG